MLHFSSITSSPTKTNKFLHSFQLRICFFVWNEETPGGWLKKNTAYVFLFVCLFRFFKNFYLRNREKSNEEQFFDIIVAHKWFSVSGKINKKPFCCIILEMYFFIHTFHFLFTRC